MKKLLQLNTSVGKGATGRIAETIASLAVAQGWGCYIAHGGRYMGKTQMTTIQTSSRIDEFAHFCKSILFDAHGLGSLRATKLLIGRIKELSPDVIQIHNLHGYWINYDVLFRFLRASDIPVVWTLHDTWAITGHCAIFPSLECEKWKTECVNCPGLSIYPRSFLGDSSSRNYRLKKELFTSVPQLRLVTVSNWLHDIVKQSYLKDLPQLVIPNGVNLGIFYPRDNAVDSVREKYGLKDKIVLLTVADKWSEEIGFSDLPRLRFLLDEHFAIVVVGVTKEQQAMLPEGIIGILHTNSRDELAELYSASDIFFAPQPVCSFSLVTAEAMACGTPSIVYSPAAAGVMGENGYVIPSRDIVQLSKTLKSFADSGGKTVFRESCVQRASQLFDERKNYRKYIDLYDSIS